jgi:hypothetical protein
MPQQPIDYTKGLIYKIVCLDVNVKEIYVGSTTNFVKRKNQHKGSCNDEWKKDYNLNVYKFIRAKGGWINWKMELVQYFPTDDKLKLLKREGEILRELNATLNIRMPCGQTSKEWREINRDKLLKYYNENYKNNREKRLADRKEYRETNKIIITEKKKEKYNCRCGSCICVGVKTRHEKTQKHINYIQSLANVKV